MELTAEDTLANGFERYESGVLIRIENCKHINLKKMKKATKKLLGYTLKGIID